MAPRVCWRCAAGYGLQDTVRTAREQSQKIKIDRMPERWPWLRIRPNRHARRLRATACCVGGRLLRRAAGDRGTARAVRGMLSARRVAVGLDVAGRVGAQRRERQEAAPTVCTLLRTTPAAADGAGRVGPGGEPAAGRFDHRAALAQQPGPRPQEPRRLPTPAPEQGDE